jgi:phosphoribosyl 1,2-cyclic phosphodiesterase/ActR/RegA family two-component response regulator
VKTILVIDDDELCRAPAAELLRRADWHVLEACDGESGIEMAIQHRPDVILCDLMMPRGNGFQVCRAVRKHMELRNTKIIVVTGRDYTADRKSAEEAGADDYLVKPIELAKLEDSLSRLQPGGLLSGNAQGSAPAASNGASDVRLRFWGVRGSIPTPGETTVKFGGNTSCVELRADGEIIILDAGSGIRPLGHALNREFNGRPMKLTLLITHTHWDHIQGFPFFVPAYDPRNQIRILGYEGARDGLRTTLAGQMESPYFPIELDEMPGNIVIEELKEMNFSIGSIKVEACFTNHPGVCVAYRIFTNCGLLVYMPDNESFTRRHSSGNGAAALPSTLEGHLLEFVRDADVLICDSQYDAGEYKAHIGWGHGCVDEVVRLAMTAKVKRLFLFHHDPTHDDDFIAALVAHARRVAEQAGSPLHIEAAREGVQVLLGHVPK